MRNKSLNPWYLKERKTKDHHLVWWVNLLVICDSCFCRSAHVFVNKRRGPKARDGKFYIHRSATSGHCEKRPSSYPHNQKISSSSAGAAADEEPGRDFTAAGTGNLLLLHPTAPTLDMAQGGSRRAVKMIGDCDKNMVWCIFTPIETYGNIRNVIKVASVSWVMCV